MKKFLLFVFAALVVFMAGVDVRAEGRRMEMSCLALNIYHEARGEGIEGMVAVGYVTRNRVESKRFPDTFCEVVHQNRRPGTRKCQFSWTCDPRTKEPSDYMSLEVSYAIAQGIVLGLMGDPTGGALHYFAKGKRLVWASRLRFSQAIGRHVYYVAR